MTMYRCPHHTGARDWAACQTCRALHAAHLDPVHVARMYEMVYWMVHGDPRMSHGEFRRSMKRQARALWKDMAG